MARRSDHTRPELRALALDAARKIIRGDGVSALTTRKLADRIGYTSGTIYQVFRNRDDLIEQVNAKTLERLYAHCVPLPGKGGVQGRLRHLADRFVSFAKDNPREWDAIINYPFAPDHQASVEYSARIDQLLNLLQDAISELYSPEEPERRERDARLLWNSLYGIFALSVAGRLNAKRPLSDAVEDLIDLFLAARA